jgi:enoyl-CoA hydratase
MLNAAERDGIVTIKLERGKAHALDLDLCRALTEAFTEIEQDERATAMILTGTGAVFSAGVDLVRYLEGGDDYVDAFVPSFVEALRILFAMSKPAVAAINGHAIAGGCALAAACDYRIMEKGHGTIGVPALKVGLPFPLVAIEILRFATSEAHLQELVYRGKMYGVSDAYSHGLVDEIAEQGALLDRARTVASQLAEEPSARFRITKQQLRAPALERMLRYAADTDSSVLAEWKDPATVNAIRLYVSQMQKERGP